jgi:hypothetical protein
MNQVKIKEAVGFTKVEALATEKIGFDVLTLSGSNATQAWIKAGKPANGTNGFKVFASEQLKKKTKFKEGLGAYVIVEAGVADTRERPYKVIPVITDGARKFKRTHQIIEAELATKLVKENVTDENGVVTVKEVLVAEIISLGAVVATADKKSEALDEMKDWISAEKRDYVVVIAKEVVEGKAIAAYGVYTPSISAKEGTYVAFGVEL